MTDLPNLLQNLHPNINFTMEHNFKELPFLGIFIKNLMAKLSQIFFKDPQTPSHTSIWRFITPNTE